MFINLKNINNFVLKRITITVIKNNNFNKVLKSINMIYKKLILFLFLKLTYKINTIFVVDVRTFFLI